MFDNSYFEDGASLVIVTDIDYKDDGMAGLGFADKQFVYLNTGSTHKLYYDFNGDGSGANALIATFDSDVGLTDTDIDFYTPV